jgi:flagellar protein FlaJ
MSKISKKIRKIAAIGSLAGAVAIILVGILLFMDQLNTFLFFGLLVAFIPTAVLDYINETWQNAVNDKLPQLVRDLSEAQETGQTIVKALDQASQIKYGPLSEEVKKISIQMSWGSSFDKALHTFAQRIDTLTARRFCILVIEAMRTGGRIRKVFSMTAESMEETLQLNKERVSQMRPYIIIIYAAFFVFLFTTIQLLTSFFVPLAEIEMTGFMTPLGTGEMFTTFFYHMMMIQSVLGGIVAGKIGNGRIISGLKHAIIMMVAGYVAYTLIL